MWSMKRTHISMTLVDPYVVCEKITHAMTLVFVSNKNTHAITLVDPCVVFEENTHAMTLAIVNEKNTHAITLLDP